MKFIVSSSLLVKQLSSLSGVINSNNTLPILDNFLFELEGNNLTISASDLETTMTARLDVQASESGSVAIPAKMVIDTLKTFPSDTPVTFIIDPENYGISISAIEGKYKLAGQNGAEFPRIPQIEGTTTVEMGGKALSNAFTRTIFATGNDELRPVMSGVFVDMQPDHVTFVATDAHKLVRIRRYDISSEEPHSFILPKKPINLLKNTLSSFDGVVRIDYNSSNAFFSFGNINLICRLVDGKYPNYEAVIPKENPNKLTIDRVNLLNSIKRVSIFSNQSTHQVRLKIAGNELLISAEDLDYANSANERLTCQYEGTDMEIGFNAKFVLEMLNSLDTDLVSIEMSLPNRAGILVPVAHSDEQEDILMLVMPVMIN